MFPLLCFFLSLVRFLLAFLKESELTVGRLKRETPPSLSFYALNLMNPEPYSGCLCCCRRSMGAARADFCRTKLLHI